MYPGVVITTLVSLSICKLPINKSFGKNSKLANALVPLPPLTANGSGIICLPTKNAGSTGGISIYLLLLAFADALFTGLGPASLKSVSVT